MANVYSKQFWAFNNPPLFQNGPTVPAGVVWDIREILVFNVGSDRKAVGGFGLGSTEVTRIFSRFRGMNRGWENYRWQGRCVLNPGDQLFFASTGPLWIGWVCGYELTLP